MSILSRLFGGKSGGAEPTAEAVEYNGYAITPDPAKEGPRYRIRAHIDREVDGEPKRHTLIRADTLESKEAAEAASIDKAKLMIDQQGLGIFN